jgi:microcystin-dependent protein
MSQGFVNSTNNQNLILPGMMFDYAGTSPPSGYLQCDGSPVSRTTYAALFSAIGTTWGSGDGSTTFNIPDFRRKIAVGSGGTGTGSLGNAVGNTGGAESHTIANANLPTGCPYTTGSTVTHVSSNTGAAGFVPASGSTWSYGSATAISNFQPSSVVLKIIKT